MLDSERSRASGQEDRAGFVALPPQSPTDVLDLLPPYPIVLVTTRSNVLTVNQIAYFTFRPLRIGIGIAHARFSYDLLQAEGEFVVNVPGPSLISAVKLCGSRSGRDGSKFEAARLTRTSSRRVQSVGLAECGAQIECRIVQQIEFEHRAWFIGEVVSAQRQPEHQGAEAMMCGRHSYLLPGPIVEPR